VANVRSRLKQAIRRLLDSPPVQSVLYAPALKRSLDHAPFARKLYKVWDRGHPFDREFGVDTLGALAEDQITRDKRLAAQIAGYLGSQPSIVRRSLAALGPVEEYTLLDFGCGKGRAAIVASEFPFRQVIGVELSPVLSAQAHANVAIIASRFPERPGITIINANVLEFALPPGKLAIFAFHPFGAEILAGMVKRLEAALAGLTPHIFFVYDNPTYADVLDASPAFQRFSAGIVPYDKSELGYGVFKHEAVVIWQSVRGAIRTPHRNIDRKVRIVNGQAELEE
jgi:SAM-dependent methyltransferase